MAFLRRSYSSEEEILGKFFKLGVAEKVLMGFLFGLGGLFLGVGFEVFSLSTRVVVACL